MSNEQQLALTLRHTLKISRRRSERQMPWMLFVSDRPGGRSHTIWIVFTVGWCFVFSERTRAMPPSPSHSTFTLLLCLFVWLVAMASPVARCAYLSSVMLQRQQQQQQQLTQFARFLQQRTAVLYVHVALHGVFMSAAQLHCRC